MGLRIYNRDDVADNLVSLAQVSTFPEWNFVVFIAKCNPDGTAFDDFEVKTDRDA